MVPDKHLRRRGGGIPGLESLPLQGEGMGWNCRQVHRSSEGSRGLYGLYVHVS